MKFKAPYRIEATRDRKNKIWKLFSMRGRNYNFMHSALLFLGGPTYNMPNEVGYISAGGDSFTISNLGGIGKPGDHFSFSYPASNLSGVEVIRHSECHSPANPCRPGCSGYRKAVR